MPDPRILKDVISNIRMVHETLSFAPEGDERMSNMTTLLRDSLRAVDLYLVELERETEEKREFEDQAKAQLEYIAETMKYIEGWMANADVSLARFDSANVDFTGRIFAIEQSFTNFREHFKRLEMKSEVLDNSCRNLLALHNQVEKKLEAVKEYLDSHMEDVTLPVPGQDR